MVPVNFLLPAIVSSSVKCTTLLPVLFTQPQVAICLLVSLIVSVGSGAVAVVVPVLSTWTCISETYCLLPLLANN